jgi:hypothetical protein
MNRKRVAAAAYWWVAGQFCWSTMDYQRHNPKEFANVPWPVMVALPLIFGAAWPVVLLVGLPNLLRRPKRPEPVLVGQKNPTLRVVE